MTFWARWYGGKDGDMRPLSGKPKDIEWWCSGEREPEPQFVICALVTARSETDVWAKVHEEWPEAVPSFCEEKETGWRPDSARFAPNRGSKAGER